MAEKKQYAANLYKYLLAAFLLICISLAFAEAKQDLIANMYQKLIDKYPQTKGAKVEPSFPGFFSVVKGSEVLFVKDDLSVLINGEVIDLNNNKSLTSELRYANRVRINIKDLNQNDAIQFGSGTRKLFVFSDPDCPYCRQLEHELSKLQNTQIFVFPFPLVSLHPNAKQIAESVWCADNRALAWKEYVLHGKTPPLKNCDNPINRNLALGQQYEIQGTPALVFEDGTVIPGAVPIQRIEAQLLAAQKK